jgi:hypothetical protein
MAVDPVAMPQAVRQALERASAATGVDFTVLAETARRESSFNARARAPTSSATGLFQFIESTWFDMVRRHGAEHGLGDAARQIAVVDGKPRVADDDARRAILALRNDPELSARMAGELARENAAALEARIGRAPTAGEVYAAHVMGAGGAARLIDAAARGAPDAAALFPREAAANPWLFRGEGAPRSAQDLLARLNIAGEAVTGERNNGRIDVVHGDSGDMAAFIDAMFQMLLRDMLAPAQNESDPLHAAASYAKLQRG